MEVRLGELLVERGVLTASQVQRLLDIQSESGEPFGVIAERVYGVDPAAIEDAWAVQYASLTRTVDPASEPIDLQVLELVSRRQAWQFGILPIRFDGRELMIATTIRHLRRALRFATNVIGLPVFFVLSDEAALGAALARHYPIAGLTPDAVGADGVGAILRR